MPGKQTAVARRTQAVRHGDAPPESLPVASSRRVADWQNQHRLDLCGQRTAVTNRRHGSGDMKNRHLRPRRRGPERQRAGLLYRGSGGEAAHLRDQQQGHRHRQHPHADDSESGGVRCRLRLWPLPGGNTAGKLSKTQWTQPTGPSTVAAHPPKNRLQNFNPITMFGNESLAHRRVRSIDEICNRRIPRFCLADWRRGVRISF